MNKKDKYADLAELVLGSSYIQLFTMLYKLALLRYATTDQMRRISLKVGTGNKIEKLASLGYIKLYPQGVSVITSKGVNLLKENGFLFKHFSDVLQDGISDERLGISSVIHDIMAEEDFYTVFYPHFDFLIPDACAVFRKDGKARLLFIEVEKKKGNWGKYLLEKKEKYERIGGDPDIYDKWWRRWSDILKLQLCPVEEFCFSVRCYSELKFDWQGWSFTDHGSV